MFALPQSSHIIPISQKSNEWYTPARYIEAARKVMGGIDLDPASCAVANETIKAGRYYTEQENGLVQEWYGRVWLNPPFIRDCVGDSRFGGGKSRMGIWVSKLVREYSQKNIDQAILLTTNKADISWFDQLWDYPICFTHQRVLFDRPGYPREHNKQGHFFGTIFVYFGSNEQKFIDIFSRFGRIAKAIDTPRKTVMPLSLWEAQ